MVVIKPIAAKMGHFFSCARREGGNFPLAPAAADNWITFSDNNNYWTGFVSWPWVNASHAHTLTLLKWATILCCGHERVGAVTFVVAIFPSMLSAWFQVPGCAPSQPRKCLRLVKSEQERDKKISSISWPDYKNFDDIPRKHNAGACPTASSQTCLT